jgi:PAS domain S-box-containing protein
LFTEAIYEQLYQHAPNPHAVFALDGRCLLTNLAFSTQLDHDRDDWLQGDYAFPDLFKDDEYARELMHEILDRQVIRHREVKIRRKAGEPSPMLLSARVFELDGEEFIEISLIDYTRHRRHQRSLWRENARQASLLEAITAGIFLINENEEIVETNLALENLLGFQHDSLKGKGYQELFGLLISRAIEPEVVQQTLSRSVTSVTERPTAEIVLDSESPTYIELTLFPVWDHSGKSIGWGGLVQDVTELKDQVSWKLDLLSILAHDIRAPLASLKGHATALLDNFQQWGDEMVMDFLAAIDRSTDQLVRQVDRSLALTRVEAGRMGLKPESVQIQGLVQGALERLQANYDSTDIQISLPEDTPTVRVDPGRIEEVLINLIDNGLRYSPANEAIRINAEKLGAMLQVAVSDMGPGIPAADQATIFNKYTQSQGEEGGSGLGLFISRKIIEAHGGKIWLESPPEGQETGTRFTFTLPIMPEQAEERRPPAVEKERTPVRDELAVAEGEAVKVLIVEDEPDFQALMKTVVNDAGYLDEIIDNGRDAIDLLQMAPYDIVLLDWNLPGMQGIEVCRNVRRWSDVPILMVTSHTSTEELITALDAGADDYITKPFRTEELLARMRAVLRRKGSFLEEERDQLSSGGILINFDSQEVWSHGKYVELTPTEFNLFAYLARNEGQVLTYDQLLDHLYGPDEERKRHDLFVHISRLRKKLEPDPDDPRYILTRWGVGYMFKSG